VPSSGWSRSGCNRVWRKVPRPPPELQEQLAGVVSGLTAVSAELQQISRGIHPTILSRGGLGPALKTLVRRGPIPANVDVDVERRLPEPVAVAA
jgi:signal transduction histidine kinase